MLRSSTSTLPQRSRARPPPGCPFKATPIEPVASTIAIRGGAVAFLDSVG
jgi:hypothetical protein